MGVVRGVVWGCWGVREVVGVMWEKGGMDLGIGKRLGALRSIMGLKALPRASVQEC